ncbi:MAG TPA: 4-hydroxythreonine-4-phosphate dehydrogenase PdxA [Thermodesulfobacteriota bacterium]|nr:4-hydroxythreonine-4-phosphate dehydrogenase PdxA [Thermodesulfobacteriota bacterium]
MNREKPIVGITMGDPAGIGPEITVKAIVSPEIQNVCRPMIIGDARVARKALREENIDVPIHVVTSLGEANWNSSGIRILDTRNADPEKIAVGQPSAVGGRAVFEDVERAVQLAQGKQVSGIVAGPHNKYSVNLAGVPFAGYPPLIAKLTGSPYSFNMLVSGTIRIVGATLHLALKDVCGAVSQDLVLAVIEAVQTALNRLGIPHPRIAVAGLNPHCGEEGLFGTEEETIIGPAIETAQRQGIKASGPYPADSLFVRLKESPAFDAYVAMYHDQSHIPIKTVAFDSIAGLIIGTPLVIATVGHGTAFEIAGKGRANPRPMKEAITLVALSCDA